MHRDARHRARYHTESTIVRLWEGMFSQTYMTATSLSKPVTASWPVTVKGAGTGQGASNSGVVCQSFGAW